MNLSNNFTQVGILIGIGLLGSLAIIPYSITMQQNVTLTPIRVVLSLVQTIIMLIGASILGLLASRSLGLPLNLIYLCYE